jgi:hypothetical protein
LPDPEVLAQCLRDSFQEYLALAQHALKRKSPASRPARLVPVPAKRARARRKPATQQAGAAL